MKYFLLLWSVLTTLPSFAQLGRQEISLNSSLNYSRENERYSDETAVILPGYSIALGYQFFVSKNLAFQTKLEYLYTENAAVYDSELLAGQIYYSPPPYRRQTSVGSVYIPMSASFYFLPSSAKVRPAVEMGVSAGKELFKEVTTFFREREYNSSFSEKFHFENNWKLALNCGLKTRINFNENLFSELGASYRLHWYHPAGSSSYETHLWQFSLVLGFSMKKGKPKEE